ncbi:uncharacterized protein METZ01_LOCUS439239, partial [marine metagenome]
FVDHESDVWVTDARGHDGKGHQIHKFNPQGDLLLSLGVAGIGGVGDQIFNAPSDLVVARDGTIFIADGHGGGGNNRIVKLSSAGVYIKEWGATGGEDGEFRDPHGMAIDSQGRIFVADRRNRRIQIFDQDGTHLDSWYQFGVPSGIFIDGEDILYACDVGADDARTDGFLRGIRIGSVTDGRVVAFIPDPGLDTNGNPTEGVAVDGKGNIYGAEVGEGRLTRYAKQ